MKVWVTSQLFSKGIREEEAVLDEHFPDVVKLTDPKWRFREWRYKPYWHATRDEAVKWAESERIAKIKLLENQIEKIKDMDFLE